MNYNFSRLVAFELWLACYTQEEIAGMVDCPRTTVEAVLTESAELPKSAKPYADHLVDFTPPIYNVWKFKERTTGNSHFGNTEPTNKFWWTKVPVNSARLLFPNIAPGRWLVKK
ncbi:MAG: hypothetical protein IID17_04470 [Nitrospinae bacterium]|nr:hypothetical protein [Nitrospinota bacterium]